MTINRIDLKEDAKVIIAATRPSPATVTFAYLVISVILSGIQRNLDKRFDVWFRGFRLFVWHGEPWPVLTLTNIMLLSALFVILLRIVSSVLSTGYSWYSLRVSRSLKAAFSNIFDPMNAIFKVIGLIVVTSVFTFLWSLLLFIPGVIAAYSYRQAFYILYDHPEYGILDCIRESKHMMRGYKTDLFILDLSFLGWIILCVLTMGILFIWKMPYFEVTYSGYYNVLRGFAGYHPPEEGGGTDPWDIK